LPPCALWEYSRPLLKNPEVQKFTVHKGIMRVSL
jgi:hypothetical protein